MNTYHPSNSGAQQRNQLGDDRRRRNGSSKAPASSVDSQEARTTVLEEEVAQVLCLLKASCVNSPSRSDDIMHLRIPTKSANCPPGPTLNPASCASGLALLGGGGGGDWISALSLTDLVEGMNSSSSQGTCNTHGRNSNSTHQNEDWADFHLTQGNQFLGGGNN